MWTEQLHHGRRIDRSSVDWTVSRRPSLRLHDDERFDVPLTRVILLLEGTQTRPLGLLPNEQDKLAVVSGLISFPGLLPTRTRCDPSCSLRVGSRAEWMHVRAATDRRLTHTDPARLNAKGCWARDRQCCMLYQDGVRFILSRSRWTRSKKKMIRCEKFVEKCGECGER